MPKKQSPTIFDQSQGFLMTDEGLLIPGRLLREMGEKIAVTFSPRLIMIAPSHPSRRGRSRASRKAKR